jgi:hypothetical protein
MEAVLALYGEAVTGMAEAFHRLEQLVPPPELVVRPMGNVFRYEEQTVPQALIIKLARVVSGLTAVRVLLAHGLVQEQGVLQRTLDELEEDILFLGLAALDENFTEAHQRYLADFWLEEFDAPTAIDSSQKRGMIRRKNVRSYLADRLGEDRDLAIKASETLHKTFSGYVHAASTQVMDLYGGKPPRFHVSGMVGTPRIRGHALDAWNYYHRGFMAVELVAKVLGGAHVAAAMKHQSASFVKASGPMANN